MDNNTKKNIEHVLRIYTETIQIYKRLLRLNNQGLKELIERMHEKLNTLENELMKHGIRSNELKKSEF